MTDKEQADTLNAARQTLLAALAGVAAATGLAYTARTYYLSRRGQLTDRYTKAIAQLASDKLEERLGGIYALEHLMRESARDHQTVVDVLVAFVREHAPITTAAVSGPGPVGAEAVSRTRPSPRTVAGPAGDVQAALTVLGRRPHRREPHPLHLDRAQLQGASLVGARLHGASLVEAQLQGAQLDGAHLQHAQMVNAQMQGASLIGAQLQRVCLVRAGLQDALLSNAQLQGANLVWADLQDAVLDGAQLQNAMLGHAQMQGTDLEQAQLHGADLSGAQLQGASLIGAHLHGARGLESADLRSAYFGETAVDEAPRTTLEAVCPEAADPT